MKTTPGSRHLTHGVMSGAYSENNDSIRSTTLNSIGRTLVNSTSNYENYLQYCLENNLTPLSEEDFYQN